MGRWLHPILQEIDFSYNFLTLSNWKYYLQECFLHEDALVEGSFRFFIKISRRSNFLFTRMNSFIISILNMYIIYLIVVFITLLKIKNYQTLNGAKLDLLTSSTYFSLSLTLCLNDSISAKSTTIKAIC